MCVLAYELNMLKSHDEIKLLIQGERMAMIKKSSITVRLCASKEFVF